jgi:hypothetical protein
MALSNSTHTLECHFPFFIQFDHFLFHLIFYSCVYTYFQERYPFLVLPPAHAHTPLADGHIRVPPRDRSSPDTRASPLATFRRTSSELVARCQSSHGPRRQPRSRGTSPTPATWAPPRAPLPKFNDGKIYFSLHTRALAICRKHDWCIFE